MGMNGDERKIGRVPATLGVVMGGFLLIVALVVLLMVVL